MSYVDISQFDDHDHSVIYKAFKNIKEWLKEWLKPPVRCNHEWKCVHQVHHRIFDEPWDKYPSEEYLVKTWECQKCGKIKYVTQEL